MISFGGEVGVLGIGGGYYKFDELNGHPVIPAVGE